MTSYMADMTRQYKRVLGPLGKAEEGRAVRAAVAWVTTQAGPVRDLRYPVLGAELRIEKPRRREEVPPRWIQVLIADYTHRRQHRGYQIELPQTAGRDKYSTGDLWVMV